VNSRRAAALIWVLSAVIALAGAVFLVLGPGRPVQDDVFGGVGGAAFLLLSVSFTTVGAIVAARVPGNRIGWVFCACGVAVGAVTLAWAYADYGLHATAEPLPGAKLAPAFPGEPLAALLAFPLLLFPDGRLPSRRWRPLVWLLGVAATLLAVTDLFRPGPFDQPFASVSNPLGVAGTRDAMEALNGIAWVLVVVGIALAAASVLVRRRRARGVERQQLELVLAVGAIVGAVVVLDMCTWLLWPHGALQVRMAVIGVAFAAFPAAAGVAILRYRLYDIDVVVNRTLVYVLLTALLAAAYGVTALVLGIALGSSSAWTTAGATLAAAVAFRPLRARVQDAVDRRFNRARYDALHRVTRFLDDLRADRVAPEGIEDLLRELAADPTLELRFFLSESELYVDARGLPARDTPGDTRVRTPIERAGAPVGVVLHQPASRDQPDLLPRLVEAGGLAIEIARLRVELRRQLAEVEGSRARIVAAAYEVFILARMREEYDRTGSTEAAVVRGLGRTGRLVTCAALILFLAFASMASAPDTDTKIAATGLAAGILLDATVIRALIVPALVMVLGRWNWWLPSWPARLLRVEPSLPPRRPAEATAGAVDVL
jgi:MMPL family protein